MEGGRLHRDGCLLRAPQCIYPCQAGCMTPSMYSSIAIHYTDYRVISIKFYIRLHTSLWGAGSHSLIPLFYFQRLPAHVWPTQPTAGSQCPVRCSPPLPPTSATMALCWWERGPGLVRTMGSGLGQSLGVKVGTVRVMGLLLSPPGII